MTALVEEQESEALETPSDTDKDLTFEEKFATWDPEKAIRIKDPKARAYVLDQLFWNHELHHKSFEFYNRVLGFIRKAIERYGIEEQQDDEDLPFQIYNKICEAINSYFNPYKANVVTFLHKVLFNHIKLRAYHVNKYKNGVFYNKYYTYDSILKSITRNMTTQDLITLENYFDSLNNISISKDTRNFLKTDLIKIAPKNNILFKTVIWEILQSNEEMEIGKLKSNSFNNRTDRESVEDRRSKIRRS